MLKGTSRMPTSFNTPDDADPRLANMLTLYKQPATIRDMREVFFYTSVAANLTNVDPILQQFGYNILDNPGINRPGFIKYLLNNYYERIGTTRKLDISNLISDLIDIRVPKDKYVVEINLAECTLEVDSEEWQSIPEFAIRFGRALGSAPDINGAKAINRDPVYKWTLTEAAAPGTNTPPRNNFNSSLVQAKKLTEPQTLFIRIKELDNGQPYNWSVTNSGSYSIDKGHQLLIRHGDVNYANMTLEFGHLVYEGNDVDYQNFIRNNRENTDAVNTSLNATSQIVRPDIGKLPINIKNYDNYRYYDYNSELYNVAGSVTPVGANMFAGWAFDQEYAYPNDIYPKMYGGGDPKFCFDKIYNTYGEVPIGTSGENNIERPTNRPPFTYIGVKDSTNVSGNITGATNQQVYQVSTDPGGFTDDDFGYTEDPYLLQGRPLLFNQQVSRLQFRFVIRLIHLF